MKKTRTAPGSFLLSGGILLVALGLVVGCASNPEPFQSPPEMAPPVVDDPGAPDEQAADEEAEEPASRESLSVVISEGGEDSESLETLVAAAHKERQRRQESSPPAIVITDENLAEHAATGDLTIASGTGRPGPERDASGRTAPASAVDEERYWRERVRAARLSWRSTVEEIAHLEERVAELRRRFYAEDDPYYRDTQIKPSWDQSLERLEEARDAAEEYRIRVQEILEEGRRAGALPGWLREGIELEPQAGDSSRSDRPNEHEIREPTVVEPTEPGT